MAPRQCAPFALLILLPFVALSAPAPDGPDPDAPAPSGAMCECRCCWEIGSGRRECSARPYEFILFPRQCATLCTSEMCSKRFAQTCRPANGALTATCERTAQRSVPLLFFVVGAVGLLIVAAVRRAPALSHEENELLHRTSELDRREMEMRSAQDYGAAKEAVNAEEIPFLVTPPEEGVMVRELAPIRDEDQVFMAEERALTRQPVGKDLEGVEEWDKMIACQPYHSLTPYLTALRAEAKRLARHYNGALGNGPDLVQRALHLSQMLGNAGRDVVIEPPFRFDYGSNIFVGDNFYANFDCVFLDCARIYIGSDVLLGPSVHLYTATHPLDSHSRHVLEVESAGEIRIGNKVWIGGSVIVLANVTIGDGCVIGAGSVVTKSIPPYSLAVGNPARVIRKLT